jgi:hypothetical protein
MTDLLNQPYAISLVSAANLEGLSLDGGRFFGGQLRFWAGKRASARVPFRNLELRAMIIVHHLLWSGEAFEDGAGNRVRTDDLLITNQLLYQLSYTGLLSRRSVKRTVFWPSRPQYASKILTCRSTPIQAGEVRPNGI